MKNNIFQVERLVRPNNTTAKTGNTILKCVERLNQRDKALIDGAFARQNRKFIHGVDTVNRLQELLEVLIRERRVSPLVDERDENVHEPTFVWVIPNQIRSAQQHACNRS